MQSIKLHEVLEMMILVVVEDFLIHLIQDQYQVEVSKVAVPKAEKVQNVKVLKVHVLKLKKVKEVVKLQK